jgi:hypothetical protein
MGDQGAKVPFYMKYLPLLIIASLIVGICILEAYLAKRKSKYPGLIIPAFFAVLSIIIIIGNITWDVAPWQTGIDTVIFALISNVPTIITLIIYFICRNIERRRRSLERMSVQDLE